MCFAIKLSKPKLHNCACVCVWECAHVARTR